MKTIKQIAEMCNCSKTSIVRTIKELDIVLHPSGNKNLVSESDVLRIVAFWNNDVLNCGENLKNETNQDNTNSEEEKTTQNETSPSNSVSNENTVKENNNLDIVNFLLEQIKVKDSQITEKDSQIKALQEENKMLIQSQAYTLRQLELLTTGKQEPEKTVVPEQEEAKETIIVPEEAKVEDTQPPINNKKWWQFWK